MSLGHRGRDGYLTGEVPPSGKTGMTSGAPGMGTKPSGRESTGTKK